MDSRRAERNAYSTKHGKSQQSDTGSTMPADAADADRTAGSSHKSKGHSAQKLQSVSPNPSLSLPTAGSAGSHEGGSDSDLGAAASPTHLNVRPSAVRALSGGIGLLSQPRSTSSSQSTSSKTSSVLPVLEQMPEEWPPPPPPHSRNNPVSEGTARGNVSAAGGQPTVTTSSASNPAFSAQTHTGPDSSSSTAHDSLLFSPNNRLGETQGNAAQAPMPTLLLDAPSPAPHVVKTSPPPTSEPQPVSSALLSAPDSGNASPRTPPNLRLEIPPQASTQETVARDSLRAPFAPDPENEGICTEVGSLGQEIQLESGDHLNALERIYLYTQSKATFHRIFMSRALPTYLREVTPVEAVEYVLPLLGGLAIDEEERVKETFVGELLVIIWWFFTTCRLTDQEPEPTPEPDPNVEPDPNTEPSPPPLVSVQSFSAVLASLLLSSNPTVSATARGTVVELLGRAQWIAKNTNQGSVGGVQHKQFCEAIRPVGSWEQGLLGPDEARMIQLEIIYGVIIDLGRLDLNGDEMAAAEAGYAEAEEGVEETAKQNAPYDPELNTAEDDLSASDPASSLDGKQHPSFSSSEFPKPGAMSMSDSALTPTPANSKSYTDQMTNFSSYSESALSSTSRSVPATAQSQPVAMVNGVEGFASNSSLNLPELSPGDSSSRSSVASPAEPLSPPEDSGADYVTTRSANGSQERLGEGDDDVDLGEGSAHTSDDSLTITRPGHKSSAPSSPGTDEGLTWHTANNSDSEVDAQHQYRPNVSSNSLAVPGTGYGYVRPGLGRQDSMLSVGTSEINPEDYSDAEDWMDESGAGHIEEGVEWSGADPTGGATVKSGNGAVPDADEGEVGDGIATEVGDPLVSGDGVEDAYIDDGAAAEEAAIGRVASMSLIAAVTSSGVVDDQIYMLFVEEVMRVSTDTVYWVRSETSYALGTLAKAVGEEVVEPYLLPILESLMTDPEGHVRQASVFAIPSVLKRLSPPRRREIAMRYVLQLCEDSVDTVRTGALQVLAEVIHTFHEDKDGPPNELLDFFLQGEHNQVCASLSDPEWENKATLENGWGPEPPSSWGEPNSYFVSEPSFPDADRALICAFNLPAVALTLGPTRWSRISGYYSYLAQESWHTPKVRSTLAASTGEIARIIGPKPARRDVVPVWWTCMTGDQREVKIKALNALPVLLEALDAEGRKYIAQKLDEVWGKHVAGWKERETFAKQLATIAPVLKDEGMILCRIFKSGLQDRVAAVREAVVAATPVFHQVLENNEAHARVARDDLFALAASETYRHQTTFLACCRALIESPQGYAILNDPRFSRSITPLAAHSVIDVRIGLGRLLTSICEYRMTKRNHRPVWLTQCLERLSLDASPDVRPYVHRVAYAEFIELRLPADLPNSKPHERPASPDFAEFSRPP